MSKLTCTSHCAGCDQHFHGVSAFDRHREDGACERGDRTVVQTGKHQGEPALQVWTADGHCDKMKGCWKDGRRLKYVHPVTIYNEVTNAALGKA